MSSNEVSLNLILQFIKDSAGLSITQKEACLEIQQKSDGKVIRFDEKRVEEVISRLDSDGQDFLQVNFVDGKKILLTQKLVGFKPAQCVNLDMDKLPKVVTTPDLISVVEAIEESMRLDSDLACNEVEVLRKVFGAVLDGGEDVGFDLTNERAWLRRIIPQKASA